jgi:hypothetical protein
LMEATSNRVAGTGLWANKAVGKGRRGRISGKSAGKNVASSPGANRCAVDGSVEEPSVARMRVSNAVGRNGRVLRQCVLRVRANDLTDCGVLAVSVLAAWSSRRRCHRLWGEET